MSVRDEILSRSVSDASANDAIHGLDVLAASGIVELAACLKSDRGVTSSAALVVADSGAISVVVACPEPIEKAAANLSNVASSERFANCERSMLDVAA